MPNQIRLYILFIHFAINTCAASLDRPRWDVSNSIYSPPDQRLSDQKNSSNAALSQEFNDFTFTNPIYKESYSIPPSLADSELQQKGNIPDPTHGTKAVLKRRRKRGSIIYHFGRHSSYIDHIHPIYTDTVKPVTTSSRLTAPPFSKRSKNRFRILPEDRSFDDKNIPPTFESGDKQVSLTIDSSSAGRLLLVFFKISGCSMNAFLGTLRLLAPLIFSRRLLVGIGNFLTDYLRGRYFRHAYSRLEVLALRYYELPAALRSLARATSHIVCLLMLSSLMGWLVGIAHSPCRSDGRGLAFFCGLLWVGSVVGAGDAFASAISVWGGPLRVQAAIDPRNRSRRARFKQFLTNPSLIIKWMQTPDKWNGFPKPFNPNPLLFPVAWTPLRMIQIAFMAKILSTEPCDYSWKSDGVDRVPLLMKSFLIQSGLRDEWLLVFFRERRVGLALFVIFTYLIALTAFVIECAKANLKIVAYSLPSILASLITTWMNLVIFWNRLDDKKKLVVLNSLPFTRRRYLNEIGNMYYFNVVPGMY